MVAGWDSMSQSTDLSHEIVALNECHYTLQTLKVGIGTVLAHLAASRHGSKTTSAEVFEGSFRK